eukprot:GEMP01009758.1.p1 GENE.GEMP01009758.1~~GEMP01009758.1.p1  ORF type:complete len:622 (+),score=111.21 GEMP01009758.1:196-2061(+)
MSKDKKQDQRAAVAIPKKGGGKWKGKNAISSDDKSDRSKLSTFYHSSTFQILNMMVIVADALVIGWECECLSRYYECNESTVAFFDVFDYTASFLLILGLIIQIIVKGRLILYDFIGIFEVIIIVVFSVFGTFIYKVALADQFPENEGLKNFLRMGRVCRVIVLIRATEDLRAFPYLQDLYLLVRGLRDSLQTLISSVIILSLVVFTTGVILTAYIGQSSTENWSAVSINYKKESFSSVWGSMKVLFRFVFVDDAADIIEPLSRDVKYLWYMIMLFILISVFLVMNLIMAVIVNQAMVFTKNDKEHRAKQLQKEKEHYTKKVIRFFNKIDLDGNAKLTYQEFERAFEHPEIRNDLLAVGVEVNELRELFFILDTSNTGELAVADFVTGMQRIRGQATSRDLLMISQYTRRVFKLLMKIKNSSTGGKGGDGGDDGKSDAPVRKKLLKLEQDVDSTRALVRELGKLLSEEVAPGPALAIRTRSKSVDDKRDKNDNGKAAKTNGDRPSKKSSETVKKAAGLTRHGSANETKTDRPKVRSFLSDPTSKTDKGRTISGDKERTSRRQSNQTGDKETTSRQSNQTGATDLKMGLLKKLKADKDRTNNTDEQSKKKLVRGQLKNVDVK